MYDAVVLSGGGIKGISQLGVLHYFFEKEECDFQEYAGTSIGSVIALLLVCGYKPYDIFLIICEIENFIENSTIHVKELYSKLGIFDISNFTSKIEVLVKEKLGIKKIPTMKELYDITEKKLYISGTNISHMCEEKYSYITSPDMNCIQAIKISCCLPLIFQRIYYRESYLIDGGLTNNFPWDYLSSSKKTLGVITLTDEISLPGDNFLSFIFRCIILPINEMTKLRSRLAPSSVDTIFLSNDDISPLYFSLSQEKKVSMFLEGYEEARRIDSIEKLYIEDWNIDF